MRTERTNRSRALGIVVMAGVAGLALTQMHCKKKGTEPSGQSAGAMAGDMGAKEGADEVPEAMRMAPDGPRWEPRFEGTGADLEAVKLLDEAIAAHGGLALLKEKLSAYTTDAKGTFHGVPYTSKNFWTAPDRMVMSIESFQMTMGYVGKTCWTKQLALVMDCPPEEAKVSEEMQKASHWSTLYPLKEAGVVLRMAKPYVAGKKPHKGRQGAEGRAAMEGEAAMAPEGDAAGQPAKAHPPLPGILVTEQGGSGFKAELFFDPESKLLRRIAYLGHWGPKTGLLVTKIERYEKRDGIQMPVQSVMKFDHKRILTEEVTQVTFGKVDEKVFERPAQAEFGKVATKEMPPGQVAFAMRKGGYKEIGETVGALERWVAKQRLVPMGPPMLVFHKMGKDPAANETEVTLPVIAREPVETSDGIGVKVLQTTVVAYLYGQGPYDKVDPHFKSISDYAKQNRLKVSGPPMMICYSDPSRVAPDKLLYQILFPVKK